MFRKKTKMTTFLSSEALEKTESPNKKDNTVNKSGKKDKADIQIIESKLFRIKIS